MASPPTTLAESDRLFPFPAREIQRTANRKWILQHIPKGGVGAEIGVFRGHFSEVLLEQLAPRKAYFIDPWTLCGEFFNWGADYTNHNTLPTAVAKQDAMWRTERFAQTERRFIEAFFPEGADRIEEKLDWIYLDASHKFEQTLAELQAAETLLKPRGILLGDDWWPDPDGMHFGVFQAINRFTRHANFDLIACGPYGQWAMRRRGAWKPKAGR
jgi:hypothetical protein